LEINLIFEKIFANLFSGFFFAVGLCKDGLLLIFLLLDEKTYMVLGVFVQLLKVIGALLDVPLFLLLFGLIFRGNSSFLGFFGPWTPKEFVIILQKGVIFFQVF
jgi:hypothetical protein